MKYSKIHGELQLIINLEIIKTGRLTGRKFTIAELPVFRRPDDRPVD
ncbi:hypothetical protein [Enterococcus dispar]|nr:hypothetical protein [Enterococcus dispar]MDT2706781.1 hypothetical protein [Enterococcus dispar]